MKLKNKYVSLCVALLFGATLSGCYDESADIVFFTGDTLMGEDMILGNRINTITLYTNGDATADVGIANGKGGYQAKTSDEAIVKVAMEGERLLLTRGDKEGTSQVTVTDDKGNQAVLEVKVGAGVYPLYFTGRERCRAMQQGEAIANENLQSDVEGAMVGYHLLAYGGYYALMPDKIGSFASEGDKGKLLVRYEKSSQTIEGTYSFAVDSAWMAAISGPGILLTWTRLIESFSNRWLKGESWDLSHWYWPRM